MKNPLKELGEGLGQRFDSWKEKRAQHKAEKAAIKAQQPPPQGAPILWCWLLTAVGVSALVGSTWMLLVFVAGSVGHVDWFWSYAASEAGVRENAWSYESEIHLLVGIGLFLFCLAIAMFNATWLEARKHLSGLIRNIVTGIGVAVALFMISGAIVVQQRGTDARTRDEVAATQSAQVGAATAERALQRAETTLREMRNHSNQYMAVAASISPEEFERSYLSPEALRNSSPDRRDLLRRSLGASREAAALEQEIARLQGEAAAAQVGAVQAEAVSVRADGIMAAPVALLEDARKPVTAVLGELLALTAFSFALAAWASRRPYAVPSAFSGWAREDQQIEDKSAEDPIERKPVKIETQVRATNAETGEEEILVKPKPYWRKARRGTPTPVEVLPDIPPDETGVKYDAGQRQAVSVGAVDAQPPSAVPSNATEQEGGGLVQDEQVDADASQNDDHSHDAQSDDAVQSDLQEDLEQGVEAELAAEPVDLGVDVVVGGGSDDFHSDDAQADETQHREATDSESNPEDHDSTSQERSEPETRESNMLPSSVAAE